MVKAVAAIPDPMMDSARAAAYAAARALTAKHARTFYFASFQLPKAKRLHAYATYAFCRHIDDCVDHARDSSEIPLIVSSLRKLLDRAVNQTDSDPTTDGPALPWFPAFVHTLHTCQIPRSCFDDLLTGVEMDQGHVRIQDWPQLHTYCYHVAGVVGLMMTRVFGLEDRSQDSRAIDLGVAMQLTNILRDVAEDLRRDRIYLPATELEQFQISPHDLAKGKVTPAWQDFMTFQIARAREHYQRAEPGIASLPNDGSRLTVWVMRLVYAGILDEIERAGMDVFTRRARVSLAGKLSRLFTAWCHCHAGAAIS